MYLTQLRLDPRSVHARRDLGDPYEMHRTLVRAFVRDAGQTPPRFLWRAEPVVDWSEPIVLIQAIEEADWSVLEALPHYLQKPVQTKVLQLEKKLDVNNRYRFRLFANPTVTRNGKRFGLVSEEAQVSWLLRQSERAGFMLEAALVTGSELIRSQKGDTRISLLKVCFEGLLRVRDPALLTQAVHAGIGPGKAFGCGLLSLALG